MPKIEWFFGNVIFGKVQSFQFKLFRSYMDMTKKLHQGWRYVGVPASVLGLLDENSTYCLSLLFKGKKTKFKNKHFQTGKFIPPLPQFGECSTETMAQSKIRTVVHH